MRLYHGVAALAAAGMLALGATAARGGALAVSVGVPEPSQRAAYQALVDEFHAANPDVDVHLSVQDERAYRAALPAAIAGDAPPDVFTWFAGDQMRNLALRGDLDDLSDLWKANAWWNTYPGAASTVQGRQYALPYQTYAWGLFFRRDVLDRAGLREAPRDLSGLLSACSKLRRAGFTPIALGGKEGWTVAAWFDFIDLRANGYEFHARLLDGKVSYNDADVRRAFFMWKQLIDAKCFNDNALAVDERGAEALLYAGRAGMILSGTVVSAGIPDIVRPQIDYERFPTIDSGQAAAEAAPVDTFHIAARARNKSDARRFLRFVGTSAAQARLAKALGTFPANKFAPVAGSVLDLSSYKVLAEAKTNLVQGYDRDVPEAMARDGVLGFQQFLAQPAQMYTILTRLDATRATAYAAEAPEITPVARATKKN